MQRTALDRYKSTSVYVCLSVCVCLSAIQFVHDSDRSFCPIFLKFGIHTVSQKNYAKLFLSKLRQISTNFDNFWQKDGKEANIMRGALTFHLTYFASSHFRLKRRCSKLLGYTMLKVVICNKLSNDLISTQ